MVGQMNDCLYTVDIGFELKVVRDIGLTADKLCPTGGCANTCWLGQHENVLLLVLEM